MTKKQKQNQNLKQMTQALRGVGQFVGDIVQDQVDNGVGMISKVIKGAAFGARKSRVKIRPKGPVQLRPKYPVQLRPKGPACLDRVCTGAGKCNNLGSGEVQDRVNILKAGGDKNSLQSNEQTAAEILKASKKDAMPHVDALQKNISELDKDTSKGWTKEDVAMLALAAALVGSAFAATAYGVGYATQKEEYKNETHMERLQRGTEVILERLNALQRLATETLGSLTSEAAKQALAGIYENIANVATACGEAVGYLLASGAQAATAVVRGLAVLANGNPVLQEQMVDPNAKKMIEVSAQCKEDVQAAVQILEDNKFLVYEYLGGGDRSAETGQLSFNLLGGFLRYLSPLQQAGVLYDVSAALKKVQSSSTNFIANAFSGYADYEKTIDTVIAAIDKVNVSVKSLVAEINKQTNPVKTALNFGMDFDLQQKLGVQQPPQQAAAQRPQSQSQSR